MPVGVSRPISEALKQSRAILDLQDNWDDEGGRRYEPETLSRTASFLERYAVRAWTRFGIAIDAPEIGPGPDGSIDLHWNSQKDRFVLLVNIRPAGDPSGPAGFYGRDNQGTTIKGSFDPERVNSGLLEWLMK